MSSVDPQRDYFDRGLALLPSNLRDKPVICAIVAAVAAVWQCVEDTSNSASSGIDFAHASSHVLDLWGRLVREPRGGLDDIQYRRVIDARILANRSKGTTDELIEIAKLAAYPGDVVEFFRFPNASAILQVVSSTTPTPQYLARLRRIIRDAKPAGVSVVGIWAVSTPSSPPFGYDTNPTPTAGYNVGAFSYSF